MQMIENWFITVWIMQVNLSTILIKQVKRQNKHCAIVRLSNPRPAGHMSPAKGFGAARQGIFIRCSIMLSHRSTSRLVSLNLSAAKPFEKNYSSDVQAALLDIKSTK